MKMVSDCSALARAHRQWNKEFLELNNKEEAQEFFIIIILAEKWFFRAPRTYGRVHFHQWPWHHGHVYGLIFFFNISATCCSMQSIKSIAPIWEHLWSEWDKLCLWLLPHAPLLSTSWFWGRVLWWWWDLSEWPAGGRRGAACSSIGEYKLWR